MEFPRWDLSGKVAIVTGASKGIGRGIATAFANAGASVVLASRNEELLHEAAEDIRGRGGTALVHKLDVSREDEVVALVKTVAKEFGKIDILVNNAGTVLRKKAEELTTQDWDHVLDTNLKGAFWCGREVAKVMIPQRKGKIINIASIWATGARATILPYVVSKFGIYGMTKAWAVEWAPYNINVNAIAPAFIETDINAPLMADPKMMEFILSRTPLGRMGKVEDLMGAAIFLASEASNYVTGHCLFVDGGWTIRG
ncbi:MAG TPA: glucose 1-dehydrogenase [Dehalococcoidia bacterium]|nr:glucose 1-dehydrogenase [Dehalococcoidia bacterium]